jgi:hypothetical protein
MEHSPPLPEPAGAKKIPPQIHGATVKIVNMPGARTEIFGSENKSDKGILAKHLHESPPLQMEKLIMTD